MSDKGVEGWQKQFDQQAVVKTNKKLQNSYQAVRALWIYDRAAVTLETSKQRRK